jgi:hypothetical protein
VSIDDAEWQAMSTKIRAAKADRSERLVGHDAVVSKFESVLFERDPIGINFESNTDEYRSEAETIALRFLEDAPVLDPGLIVHEEFVRWFGSDVCGPRDRYDPIGRELWEIWTASQQ